MRNTRQKSELDRESASPGPGESKGVPCLRAVRKACIAWRAPALGKQCLGHPGAHIGFGEQIQST